MLCSHWLDELRLRLSPFRNGRRRAGGRDSRLTDLRRAAEILEDRTLLTVTSHFDAMSGVLSINADGFDNVAITGSGGNVLINGENPDSGAQVASAIIQIDVTAVGEIIRIISGWREGHGLASCNGTLPGAHRPAKFCEEFWPEFVSNSGGTG